MSDLDPKRRIEAERACDVPGGLCTLDVTLALLRAKLLSRGATAGERLAFELNDFRGAAYPHLASVRVDGREVYRIHDRPDELFKDDVFNDLVKALRRPV